MNIIIQELKNVIKRIRFRMKLKMIDEMWYFMGGSCFGMFSPSFYYMHTEKEIERMTAKEMEEVQELIDQMEENNVMML